MSYSYAGSNKSSLLFITDYAIKKIKNQNNIVEENILNGNNSFVNYKSNNTYRIYTASLKYTLPELNEFKSVVGGRYAYIDNGSNTNYIQTTARYTNDLYDNLSAISAEIERNFSKFSFTASLRYEYNNTKLKSFDDSLTTRKRYYSNLFPNMKIAYSPNSNVNIDFNYSRKMSRPSFYEMNPIINYDDSLSVTGGSPYIKPTLIGSFSLYLTLWDKLSLEFEYTKMKDEIVHTTILAEKNTDKPQMVPINLNKSEYYNISVSYGQTIKKWKFDLMAIMNIPYLKIPEENDIMKITRTGYSFSVRNSYSFSESISAYCDFSATTASYNTITYQHPYNNLTIGVMGKFIKNKLNIRLTATDILDGSNWNNWDEKYLNIHSKHRGNNDQTGVQISISYRFNDIKAKISTPRGNTDILDRAIN